MAIGAKPKLSAAKPKMVGRTDFVLGSRPDALRAPSPTAVQRIKPAAANTRQYGKVSGGVAQPTQPPLGAI
jgi:hypothetical protein